MARKKKELPPLPEGWREETIEHVKKIFLPEIQHEALRILNRKETETALAYMKDADPERFSVNRIIKVLRICAYYASVQPPGHSFYRNPKTATRLISSLKTVMKELQFLFDEEDGVSAEKMVFEEEDWGTRNSCHPVIVGKPHGLQTPRKQPAFWGSGRAFLWTLHESCLDR
jgi:hypothetical protein